jgi:mannan endo-1,4-beta-mannosidase
VRPDTRSFYRGYRLKPLAILLLAALAAFQLIQVPSSIASESDQPSGSPAPTAKAARPLYNTGNGFFVLNGKLYDANGKEFRIRGVNRVHWDSPSADGIVKSLANTVRWQIDFTRPASANIDEIRSQSIFMKNVPIVGNWTATCDVTETKLAAATATWVAQAAQWTTLNKYLIVNIANEWGPPNSTVWRDSYISAIHALRGAGYLGTILVDSGGCGQDINNLLNYSTAVFNSDPQKNVMFSLHIYGATPTASVGPYLAQLAALSHSAGMAFLVGEFGPGRKIGPSPTTTTPAEVIGAAEANGIGWLAWAWDDNTLANGKSDNSWFSMTYSGPGIYTATKDLTDYGQDVVLNPAYGITWHAVRASIF